MATVSSGFPLPTSEGPGVRGPGKRGREDGAYPLLLTGPPPFASGPPTLAVQAKCDPCVSSPCRNQGSCQNDPLQGYRCACPGGYKVSEARPGEAGRWEEQMQP